MNGGREQHNNSTKFTQSSSEKKTLKCHTTIAVVKRDCCEGGRMRKLKGKKVESLHI